MVAARRRSGAAATHHRRLHCRDDGSLRHRPPRGTGRPRPAPSRPLLGYNFVKFPFRRGSGERALIRVEETRMLVATIALNRFGLGARPNDPAPADAKR